MPIYNLEYNEFIASIENYIKTNQKPYWAYIDNKEKSEIPVEMTYNNKKYEKEDEILNTFADFFQSTYSEGKIDSLSNEIIHFENEMSLDMVTGYSKKKF